MPPHQGRAHGHPIRARPTATPLGRDPRPPHQDETHGHPIMAGPMATPSGRELRSSHQDETHGHPIRAGPMATPSGRDLRSSHQDETHSYPIRTRPKTIPSGQDPQPPHQDETYGHPIRVGPVASLSYGWIYRAGNSVCFGKRIQALVKKLSKPRNTIPVSVFIPQSLIILSKPSNWIKPIANSHQHLLISNRFIWASQMFRWLATLFPF